ncbi:MAG: DUF6456 domain-containing protein [Robiginitomaculum sp.]|nr:DUF6456 domain-containing protein [Robiginitomaculum sp.]
MLQLMLDKRGVIMMTGTRRDAYAIVPRGDKRCRPVGWVADDLLAHLLAQGTIVEKGTSYILDPGYKRRCVVGKAHGMDTAYANQHRNLESCNIYHPDGIKRPVRINGHLSALTKLANSRDGSGQNFLQPNEIEAASCFAADYDRSMMAAISTQNYGDTGGGKRSVNTAEHITLSALDARKRVMDALELVGPGLDKALTALCASDMTMGALEVSENWARGSGKTVLKLALSRLSEFYGCRPGASAKRSR